MSSNYSVSDEKKREEARRALLGLPPEEEMPVLPQEPTVQIPPQPVEPSPLSAEEERLKNPLYAHVHQTPPISQETPEAVSVPSVAIDQDFYKDVRTSEPPSADTYREKPSPSEYEAKKAIPIEQIQSKAKPATDLASAVETIRSIKESADKQENLPQNTTLAHIAAVALDKRAKVKEVENQDEGKRKERRMISIVLLSLSILLVLAALFGAYRDKLPRFDSPDTRNTIVQREIVLGRSIPEGLAAEIKEFSTEGEPQRITSVVGEGKEKREATVSEMLYSLGLSIPRLISQSLTGNYGVGMYGETPFIVLEVSSYEYAYPGLLEWESALPEELTTLFLLNEATSTVEWEDLTKSNIDMRIAVNDIGVEVFGYALLNQDYIIIAKNSESIQAIAPLATSLATPILLD